MSEPHDFEFTCTIGELKCGGKADHQLMELNRQQHGAEGVAAYLKYHTGLMIDSIAAEWVKRNEKPGG